MENCLLDMASFCQKTTLGYFSALQSLKLLHVYAVMFATSQLCLFLCKVFNSMLTAFHILEAEWL